MKIIWSVTDNDIRKVKAVVDNNNNAFLKIRKERNIDRKNLIISKDSVIKTLLMCLLTSQQRSGPDSLVGQFLRINPFPITYESVELSDSVDQMVKEFLVANGLTRYINKISSYFESNIKKFEHDQWSIVQKLIELSKLDSKKDERKLADELNSELIGIGPKQARNFLQALGLTRYEIPIDSRITNWLNEFGFPVTLGASPLSDVGYYHFVLDGIQELCEKADVYPCLLDAAIFSSFDNDGWTEQNSVF